MDCTELRLLLIEDNPGDIRLCRALLRESNTHTWMVDEAPSLAEGKKKIRDQNYDLIAVDLNLPDSEGLETFEQIWSLVKDSPIVILSAKDDQDLALAAVKSGAQDYLLKDDLTSDLVSRSFQYAIEYFRLSRQLASLLITDDLSGLLNRRGFITLGEQQGRLGSRSGSPLTLYIIDIDDMKSINERHGHKNGDLAIQAAAEALRRTFRESDVLGRLGGDEFAALAINSTEDHQKLIFQRLQGQIDTVQREFDLPFVLSLSLGSAVWNLQETQNLELLLQKADRALYTEKAKKNDLADYTAPPKLPFREKPPFLIDQLELLLVEDNPGDARLVEAFLSSSDKVIQITHIDRLAKINSLYGTVNFSVILLDLSLPDSHGLDTIKAVLHLYPQTPIVVFTGQDDREMALAAIQAGAQDYLVKGKFDETTLERALQYAVERQGLYLQNQEYLEGIQQSERDLQSIFNHVGLGIFQTDRKGKLTFANRVLLDLLEIDSLAEISGKNILTEHLGFDEEEIFRLAAGNLLLDGVIHTLIDNKDQELPIRLGLTASALDGELNFTGTVEDISQQLDSEQRIKLQASALNAAANAILITDTAGNIIWINRAFTDLTGYENDEVQGQNPRILNSGRQDKEFFESMWDSITSGLVWQGEMVNKRKNGSTYKERMTITPLRNDQDQITHFIGIKEDITGYMESQDLLQRRFNEVNALNKVATAGVEENDEDQLIKRVTDIIGEMFYTDHFGILLLSKSGQELLVHPSYQGIDDELRGMLFPLETGVVGKVARERKAFILNDVSGETHFIESTPGVQSELAVPMIAEGKLLGVINAESRELERFTEDDSRMMTTVAGLLGSAISQIRANKLERIQRRKAEAMAEIALALNSSLEIEKILDQILDVIGDLVPYKTASLFTCRNGEARVFRHRGYRELKLENWIEEFFIPLDNPGIVHFGEMFTKGEALLVPDTEADPNWTVLPETSWVRSYLGIPIKKDDKVLGVINIDHEIPNAFNESHIEIMEALSNQISTAMENTELYHQQQEQLEFLESLRQIDNAITGSLDLKVTLVVILTELMARLEVDAAEILLYDPDAFQIVSAARKGFQSSASGDSTMFQIGGLPGWIIQNRVTYSTSDLSQSDVPPIRAHLFEREKFIGYYGTPLISKGKVVGVLELFRREIHQTDSRWIRYAETVATQTAIAIDNSRLFSNLQKANLDLSLAYDTTLEGWALGLELRDHETEGHSRRVVELTMDLVKALNIPEEEWIHIRRGALLHDIGKMGVPDRILQKPGKLDDEEWDLMRQHPIYAEKWLRPISYLRPALDIPLYHHERWDGSGYPKGLKGTEIPLPARIFAVIDVWDALRSDRPYRKAWSKEKIIEHIKAETGKHFDPKVVTHFVKMIELDPDVE